MVNHWEDHHVDLCDLSPDEYEALIPEPGSEIMAELVLDLNLDTSSTYLVSDGVTPGTFSVAELAIKVYQAIQRQMLEYTVDFTTAYLSVLRIIKLSKVS